jgi:hypothetical protein
LWYKTSQRKEPEKQPLLGNSFVNTQNTKNIAKQRAYATLEELLESVFSVQYALRLHK